MSTLVGRGDELRRIRALFATCKEHGGGALAFVGEAGIGKTALLDLAEREALAAGFATRRLMGIMAERSLPYAGLVTLLLPDVETELDPVLDRVVQQGAIEDHSDEHVDRLADALLRHLIERSAHRPLLIAIDDAQWIDAATAAVLCSVSRMVLTEPIAIVVSATRDTATPKSTAKNSVTDAPVGCRDPLDEWPDLAVHEPALLTSDESVEVLRSLGIAGVSAAEAVPRTGGLPALLDEFGRQLVSGTVAPGRLAARIPVAYRSRIADLQPSPAKVVAMAAVEPDYRAVQALLGADTSNAVRAATRAGVVKVDAHGNVVFCHPLLRAAALAALPPSDERDLHATAASALDPVAEADAIALHLAEAATDGDASAADAMSGLAMRAAARGALVEASHAFVRAAALAPDPHVGIRLRVAAADSLYLSGDEAGAVALAEHALHLAERVEDLVVVQIALARVGTLLRPPRADMRELEQLAERVSPLDSHLAVDALWNAASKGLAAGDIGRAIELGRAAEDLARTNGYEVGLAAAGLQVAHHLFLAGAYDEADARLDALETALRTALVACLPEGIEGCLTLALVCIATERWAKAESLLDQARAVGTMLGVRLITDFADLLLADLRWRQGRWAEAAALSARAQAEEARALHWGHCMLARMAASRGDEREVTRLVNTVLALSTALDVIVLQARAHAALGHLALSNGRDEIALGHLDQVAELHAQIGLNDVGMTLWEGDHIESLVRLDRRAEALAAAERLRRAAELTDRHWPRGVVARAQGQLGPSSLARREQHFAEALAHFETLGMPFEIARTLLVRGQTVGSSSDVGEAQRQFAALGASNWAGYAERMVTPASASSPARELLIAALTAAERRVARSVAAGRTNRQVSEDLGVSIKTVEYHLAAVYRKLGIRTRGELISALSGMATLMEA